MTTVADVCQAMEQLAPLELAEAWDNVGLLVGDGRATVERVMTCLTVTPETVAEAIESNAQLVIVHHPIPFRPIQRLTTASVTGGLLWRLAAAQTSVYSAHTAYDSAAGGINQQLCRMLELTEVAPLVSGPVLGSGRRGHCPEQTLGQLVQLCKHALSLSYLRVVGDLDQTVSTVAVACGSGGTFLEAAASMHCHLLITGETNLHTCLEAQAQGIGVILLGHFASERFAMQALAELLNNQFADVQVWCSRSECDPIQLAT